MINLYNSLPGTLIISHIIPHNYLSGYQLFSTILHQIYVILAKKEKSV